MIAAIASERVILVEIVLLTAERLLFDEELSTNVVVSLYTFWHSGKHTLSCCKLHRMIFLGRGEEAFGIRK